MRGLANKTFVVAGGATAPIRNVCAFRDSNPEKVRYLVTRK